MLHVTCPSVCMLSVRYYCQVLRNFHFLDRFSNHPHYVTLCHIPSQSSWCHIPSQSSLCHIPSNPRYVTCHHNPRVTFHNNPRYVTFHHNPHVTLSHSITILIVSHSTFHQNPNYVIFYHNPHYVLLSYSITIIMSRHIPLQSSLCHIPSQSSLCHIQSQSSLCHMSYSITILMSHSITILMSHSITHVTFHHNPHVTFHHNPHCVTFHHNLHYVTFHHNPPCGSHADGRTDMTKLIVAGRNFANAPKVYSIIILPVVWYGFETWSLTVRGEQELGVFEYWVLGECLGVRLEKTA
jgi:hypothetical protein